MPNTIAKVRAQFNQSRQDLAALLPLQSPEQLGAFPRKHGSNNYLDAPAFIDSLGSLDHFELSAVPLTHKDEFSN